MSAGTAAGRELRDQFSRRPTTRSDVAFDGVVWDVVSDDVAFSDEVSFTREYVRHSGAVAVLALDEDDRILLIRQYRHPAGATLWEIPAGLLDVDGEAPHAAAARELAEEAGLRAERWNVLVDIFPSPGGNDESIRIFLATGIGEAEVGFERDDEEAELVTAWAELEDVRDRVLRGDLTNGTMATAVLALDALRRSGRDATALRPADAPWPSSPRRRSL